MKNLLTILLFPIFIFATNDVNDIDKDTKILTCSFQFGTKIYFGNKFLDQTAFSREGVFADINFYTKKNNIISKLSFSMSDAIAKEIDLSIPEQEVNFTTKIPNILACNINYSITLFRQINNFLHHGISLKMRVFPLFYSKGQIFNNATHSLGGLISSEINGSLPDLDKPSQMSYSVNYLFNNRSSISVYIFINSDWSLTNFNNHQLYPGISIKLGKILNNDFKAPWIRKTNK